MSLVVFAISPRGANDTFTVRKAYDMRLDEIAQINLTCACGHDASSHYHTAFAYSYSLQRYEEAKGRGMCLCRGCACKRYVYKEPK